MPDLVVRQASKIDRDIAELEDGLLGNARGCQTALNIGSSALSVLAGPRAAKLYGSTSGGL